MRNTCIIHFWKSPRARTQPAGASIDQQSLFTHQSESDDIIKFTAMKFALCYIQTFFEYLLLLKLKLRKHDKYLRLIKIA